MRELVKQAEAWVCETEPGSMDDTDLFHELAMAKFAELIVKECCDEIVEMADKYATFNGNVRRHIMHGAISEKLKEHFGVEG